MKQIQDSAAAQNYNNDSEEDSNENPENCGDAAPINETLFLDEDLEGLDDELNELDLDK